MEPEMCNLKQSMAIALLSIGVGWCLPGAAEQPAAVAPDLVGELAHAAHEGSDPFGAIDHAQAVMLTHRAVRELRQAALQRDVASWASERVLLEQASTHLARAVPALTGAQRERALQLLADLGCGDAACFGATRAVHLAVARPVRSATARAQCADRARQAGAGFAPR
jgi:hypothetical protein